MGWYTTGPSEMEFKYGDVHGLARDCGLGAFSIAPRLRIELEEGEEFYEFEFLTDFQTEIERLKLPWTHVEFDQDFMKASPQESLSDLTFRIQELVGPHLQSIGSMMLSFGVEEENSIQTITASFDCQWQLDKKDWPAFLNWINTFLPEPLTMEDLSRGTFEEGYALAEDREWVVVDLNDTALLGLYALGTAMVQGEELYLFQPDDDTEAVIFSVE